MTWLLRLSGRIQRAGGIPFFLFRVGVSTFPVQYEGLRLYTGAGGVIDLCLVARGAAPEAIPMADAPYDIYLVATGDPHASAWRTQYGAEIRAVRLLT